MAPGGGSQVADANAAWAAGAPSPEAYAGADWTTGLHKLQVYSEWFVWARLRVADPERCHAAALAATAALEKGQGWAAALEAGRLALTPYPPPVPAMDARVRGYVTWYAFSAIDLALAPALAHVAARAANDAQTLGAPTDQAAHIGMHAAGLPAPPVTWQPGTPRPQAAPPAGLAQGFAGGRSSWTGGAPTGRPAARKFDLVTLGPVLYGVFALVLTLVLVNQGFLVIKFGSIFGIIYTLRRAAGSPLWVTVAGIGLNAAALFIGLSPLLASRP